MVFFSLALVIGIVGPPHEFQVAAGVVCLLAYLFYVVQTIRNSGDVSESHEMDPLIMDRRADRDGGPPNSIMIIQLLLGLGAMVGGAHLFVHELLNVAEHLGVSAIILSLILAPLATELPEKANSFFWVRDGKDALALGNITGAMVFQSTIPVAIGMIFIDWNLDKFAVLSMVLGLLGGLVAYWSLRRAGQFNKPSIAIWAILYLIFLGYVIFFGGDAAAHTGGH
jgi:cation:H+ antiporter